MKRRLRSKRGVTLVEIMSTAVIVGVIASMAVPRFQAAFDRIKFRSANRDIVSTYRLARSMAITEKTQYGVYIDYNDGTVTIFKDTVNPTAYVLDSEDPIIRVDTVPSDIAFVYTDVNNGVITFAPNGSAGFLGGGNIVSHGYILDGMEMLEYFHNVLPATGRIRSYSSYEEWAEHQYSQYDG